MTIFGISTFTDTKFGIYGQTQTSVQKYDSSKMTHQNMTHQIGESVKPTNNDRVAFDSAVVDDIMNECETEDSDGSRLHSRQDFQTTPAHWPATQRC